MKLLSLGILLVLLLGFVYISPISSLYYEDTSNDSPPTDITTANSNQIGDQPATDTSERAINGDDHDNTKRESIGMPRGMSSAPNQMGSNDGTKQTGAYSLPSTQPSDQETQRKQQQDAEISTPVNKPMSRPIDDEKDRQQFKNSASFSDSAAKQADQTSSKPSSGETSQARGLGSMFGNMANIGQQSPPQQPNPLSTGQLSEEQVMNGHTDVPQEHLPKIIENNQQVDPQQQAQAIQQIPTSEQLAQAGQPGIPPGVPPGEPGNPVIAPDQLSSNGSLPASSARTFESWTNCVGASTNKYGTCKNDVECNKSKGRADGSCMGGFGVCCVMALTCGDKSLENNTFFANPDFPEPSWEARLCEVEVKRKHKKILQVMIEFEEFELAPPNSDGECMTDVFQIKLGSSRPSPYSLLRICGQNTGQHMYLDVSQIEEPLLLSVATSGGGFPRRWSIRIVQMDEKNHLLAPPGCLQYFTDTIGHFRSFNLGRNLRNLYYAVCFRIDNGYSGIRFTSNFFGMNGPVCKRRLGGPGRFNGTHLEAHPHHLVIPPPGYALPPPVPRIGYHPGGGAHPQPQYGPVTQRPPQRYKRLAYYEGESRFPRSFHEHDDKDVKFKGGLHEHEFKDFKDKDQKGFHDYEDKDYKYKDKYKHEDYEIHPHHYQHLPPPPPPGYGPPPPGYGPSSGYGSPSAGYGPPPGYGPSQSYGPSQGYGSSQSYGPSPGYGPPPSYGHSPGYGHTPGYGPTAGYGHYGPPPPDYGEYHHHHKEIDKFGQKYEHLEFKHEKNHQEKEKDERKWWFWGQKDKDDKDKSGKKDKKDKDKFTQHHEALFPMMHIPEMPHCEPRYCGHNDVITFPPSGDSISEMCGNKFNRGRGPKIISGSPLVIYVSNRGHQRGVGFDMNYEQVFYIPRPY